MFGTDDVDVYVPSVRHSIVRVIWYRSASSSTREVQHLHWVHAALRHHTRRCYFQQSIIYSVAIVQYAPVPGTCGTEILACDCANKKVKVARTRLPSVGFRSWSRFLAVSLQVTWLINPTVGCRYFPPGLQLPPATGLLPILMLGEQRHNGCEQFA